MIVKSSQTFVSSSSSLFRQDLSRWCGGVTSWYRGLFYTRASIHLPLHTDRRGTENKFYSSSSISTQYLHIYNQTCGTLTLSPAPARTSGRVTSWSARSRWRGQTTSGSSTPASTSRGSARLLSAHNTR